MGKSGNDYTIRKLNVLDIFAGAGGMSLGFSQAGFNIVAAVEKWKPAVNTYQENHQDVTIIPRDIREEQVKKMLSSLDDKFGIDIIIGGPPCQGYSNAGNRNPLDPRGQLYNDFYEIIERIQPKAFVMENVKGLVSMKVLPQDIDSKENAELKKMLVGLQRYKDLKRYGAQRVLNDAEKMEFSSLENNLGRIKRNIKKKLVPLLPIMLERATNAGYKVEYKVLNAKHHGSPQSRERIFIIGVRKDIEVEICFPEPNETIIPVQDVLRDLEGKPEQFLPNHDFTKHKPSFVKRLSKVKPGENVYENYSDAWYRLIADEPSRTVKENHGGVFVHYKEDRVLTPRELARLQDFPDDFVFLGPKSKVLKQIGNAVPVKLARSVGMAVKSSLIKL